MIFYRITCPGFPSIAKGQTTRDMEFHFKSGTLRHPPLRTKLLQFTSGFHHRYDLNTTVEWDWVSSIPGPFNQGRCKKCMWPPFPQFSRHRMYLHLILTVDSPQFTSIHLNFLKQFIHLHPFVGCGARHIFPQCYTEALPGCFAARNQGKT